MNEDLIKELDNDSLVELLTNLEMLDLECNEKIEALEGDNNE
jgi:hypothetical protein